MARTKQATTKQVTEPAPTGPAKKEEHGYEFGGPFGASLIVVFLPLVCYAFAFLCNDVSGCPVPSIRSPTALFTPPYFSTQTGTQHALEVLKKETGWPGLAGLFSVEGVLGTLAWYAWSLLLYILLPAQEVEGVELASGGRLKYRFNSILSAVLTLFLAAVGTWMLGPNFQVWTFITTHYIQILSTNILISFSLAAWVYLRSFSVKAGNTDHRELAAGGHSGNMIYDFYIGREMNPRITVPFVNTEVDVKAFMELRPGMLGWIMLDLAFMAKQYRDYGYLTDSIIIVTAMQALYVLDALYMESAILTTIDITTDGFGFMLAFGDLCWVPFTYSLQARYLSVHPIILGPLTSLAILAVGVGGYLVFRGANSQKNSFRSLGSDHPVNKGLEYITTSTGSKLLTSGWWGQARHINYLGDWMLSWSYCLPTLLAGYKIIGEDFLHPGSRIVTQEGMKGWAIPVTYFYMLYFAVLLVHRERRDEEKCRRKYGKDWEEYCRKVPSRIIPGIY